MKKPRLFVMEETLAIVKLQTSENLPVWAMKSESFFSITRTTDEISIVTDQKFIPSDDEKITRDGPWRALKVEGPLQFALVGILANLTAPLAAAGISIFAISTYDTDYLLIKEEFFQKALSALNGEGYVIEEK